MQTPASGDIIHAGKAECRINDQPRQVYAAFPEFTLQNVVESGNRLLNVGEGVVDAFADIGGGNGAITFGNRLEDIFVHLIVEFEHAAVIGFKRSVFLLGDSMCILVILCGAGGGCECNERTGGKQSNFSTHVINSLFWSFCKNHSKYSSKFA